jgi:hypothetical protein
MSLAGPHARESAARDSGRVKPPRLGGALGRSARRMLAGERDCGTDSAICAEGRL